MALRLDRGRRSHAVEWVETPDGRDATNFWLVCACGYVSLPFLGRRPDVVAGGCPVEQLELESGQHWLKLRTALSAKVA